MRINQITAIVIETNKKNQDKQKTGVERLYFFYLTTHYFGYFEITHSQRDIR